ncbi:sigma-70 family RNA polymerase sigma factor [Achromobacter sp. NFACC18-2]|uniref:sigma-70 family RNA polymerase sigma factor n=1 Tax=Achromobacter sp. NFACC18-2 TaxID=1564112 RepID=UPI0008C65462|nr:sigma-70 family RNA polymerase sigma factor [Achromobacter sp. NFACC18-2]SEJ73934.1 RNA polymerase sigma-70 factor, ECF subfamily [Achromobacter sp. NFACC18-2]
MPSSSYASRAEVQSVYQAHHQWLRGVLQRKLGNACDAADLAHDTFERLIRANVREPLLEPRAYLRTIATRLLIGRARRAALEAAYAETLALQPPAVEPSVEARALIIEALTQICELLDSLPMTSRRIFLMAQIDGLSYAEIGERLGLTPNAVQKSLARALVHCYTAVYG